MSKDSESPARLDLDSARLGMQVKHGAPPLAGEEAAPDGTNFDKQSPDGPPQERVRKIPPHLARVISFFRGLIADEGLLLDMCFEHCMDIVKENVHQNSVGVDFFAGSDGQGGNTFTAGHYATVAGPMACKLYEQVLKAVEGRSEEYVALVEEANREREKTSGKAPSGIIIP